MTAPATQNGIVRIPRPSPGNPAVAIGKRVAIALGLVVVNWVLVLLERGGYRDSVDGNLTAIDALYYTTVTLTTTGYGDIVPITQSARLVNASSSRRCACCSCSSSSAPRCRRSPSALASSSDSRAGGLSCTTTW